MSEEWGPLPSVAPSEDDDLPPVDAPLRWKLPLAMFALTVLSTFFVGVVAYVDAPFPRAIVAQAWSGGHKFEAIKHALSWLSKGGQYAVPLLTILLCHEFGHYIAARRHGVPASLPMFVPFPIPPLGTLGAIIRMPTRIRSRNALLDIGAAGPLAGLLAAIPIAYVGIRYSEMRPIQAHGEWIEEGTSALFWLIKRAAKGPIPAGHEVLLHATAMAGWVALLITMLNLLPFGQLDGGHVAHALLGKRSEWLSRVALIALPLLGVGVGLYWAAVVRRAGGDPWALGQGYTQGLNWFLFAGLVYALHRDAGGRHPPTDPGPLSTRRRWIAGFTLLLFLLLFMPVPLRTVRVP